MRPLILLLFFIFTLYAEQKAPATSLQTKQKLIIGAGPYVQSQPYEGADDLILPTPVIFFDNKLFYVRWVRVGMYFMGQSGEEFSWGASITAQPRTLGYESSDAPILEGLEEKKSSWEAGVSLAMEYQTYFAEIVFFHDILDASNGYIVRAEVGDSIRHGDWSFFPSIMAIYHSDSFNDYYYSVQSDEAIAGRPAYEADAGVDFGVQSYINYAFDKKWSAIVNLRADYISDVTYESPLVDEHYIYSGMVSLLYTFEY